LAELSRVLHGRAGPGFRAIVAVAGLFAVIAAAPPQAISPPPGSPERTAVLDALRPAGEAEHGLKVRFLVHSLRIVQGPDALFAYASVEPANGEFDRGDYILQKRGHWRVIWSVVGGGSSTCRDLSAYYLGAIRHLTKHGLEPDTLAPALSREHRRLSACDLDENEPGDMGPAI